MLISFGSSVTPKAKCITATNSFGREQLADGVVKGNQKVFPA